MCVVIVFLLLGVWEFTYSMDSQENQMDQRLFPFEFDYTGRVQEFIETKTKNFMHNIENKLILNILSSLERVTNLNLNFDHRCIPIQVSRGKYEATEGSLRACQNSCNDLNLKYVIFLNDCISQVKENFLYEIARDCNVKLNAINLNTGKCVKKGKRTFKCECTPNYQILVSPLLYIFMDSILLAETFDNPLATRIDEFAVFVLFLKYYPLSAGLYFSYLVNKYELVVNPIEIVNLDFLDGNSNTGTQLQEGLIEDKGPYLKYDQVVFQSFLNEIKNNRCNLIKFGGEHFNNFNPFTLFIILLILFQKWQTSDGNTNELLQL